MARFSGPTTQQIAFRDGYHAHGNAEKAYRDAGYAGSIKGMYRMLKAPWMDPLAAAVARVEAGPVAKAATDVLVHSPAVVDVVAAMLARPVHPLETQRGRKLWLIDVMEGKISYERAVSYFDQEGQRQDDTETVEPDIKDRLKAAELLSKMSGDHVVKVDASVSGKVDHTHRAVFVHVDNGRGPTPPVTATVTGRDPIEACGACGAVYAKGAAHICP
jgi:hypothetical protein